VLPNTKPLLPVPTTPLFATVIGRSLALMNRTVAAVPTALVVVIQGLIVITLAGASLFIERWESR